MEVTTEDKNGGLAAHKSRKELDIDNIVAHRVLGRGALGTVFLASDRSGAVAGAAKFALKVVEKRPGGGGSERRSRWELSVLSRLRHPLLPTLLGSVVETPELIAWATPFCSGGDLNALRHSLPDRTLSASAIRFYLAELVEAISHLHSLRIAFRDLKPENILLRYDGHLVLSDFDLSRFIPPSPSPPDEPSPVAPPTARHRRSLSRALFPVAPEKTRKTRSARVSPARVAGGPAAAARVRSFVGTEEYVAPEVVRGDGHDFAVDWWGLGILAHELVFGRSPFKGRSRKETFHNVLTCELSFGGSDGNGGQRRRQRTDLEDLIARLLEKDPSRRLGGAGGAEEVRAHRFFLGVRWDLLCHVSRPPFVFDGDEEVGGGAVAASEGFDVREYFKKLQQNDAAVVAPSPASSMDAEL